VGATLVRARGRKRVRAVQVQTASSGERSVSCDTVVAALGMSPRDGLLRMAVELPLDTAPIGAGEVIDPGGTGTVVTAADRTMIDGFTITNGGLRLLDVYLGPDGVLTGSARLSQEGREKAEGTSRGQELERRRQELEAYKQSAS